MSAAVDAARLDACKAYMNVDFSDDDSVIRGIMAGVDAYLYRAGVARDDRPDTYDLILHAMTLEIYDKRGAVGVQQAAASPLVRDMLTQLKLCSL